MKAHSAHAKGDRLEKYLVDRLRETIDKETHRTVGSGNGLDKNDIRIPSLNIEIEAKNQKTFHLKDDWEQTMRQLTAGNTGVLAIRHCDYPEFKKTLIVMDLEDWISLLQSQHETVEVIEKLDPKNKWVITNAIEANKKLLKLIDKSYD